MFQFFLYNFYFLLVFKKKNFIYFSFVFSYFLQTERQETIICDSNYFKRGYFLNRKKNS